MPFLPGQLMQAYDKAAPVVKEATDTAAPYVKKGLDVAGDVARPVIRAAEPVVKVGHYSIISYARKTTRFQAKVDPPSAYLHCGAPGQCYHCNIAHRAHPAGALEITRWACVAKLELLRNAVCNSYPFL